MESLMAKSKKTVINNFEKNTADTRAEKIQRYLELERQIAELNEEIEPLKTEQKLISDYFMDVLEAKETHRCEFGYAYKKESNAFSFKPELFGEFKKLFKSKVSDYVVMATSYKPSTLLKNIYKDEKSEYFTLANRAIVVTQRHSIEIKP